MNKNQAVSTGLLLFFSVKIVFSLNITSLNQLSDGESSTKLFLEITVNKVIE